MGNISKLFTDEIIATKRMYLEDLYTGTMDVFVNEYYLDEDGLEEQGWHKTIENEPCRITRQNAPQPARNRPKTTDEITQLTCAPELDIPPGSRLVITFNGRTEHYTYSASPRVYSSHQSIFLKAWSENERNYA